MNNIKITEIIVAIVFAITVVVTFAVPVVMILALWDLIGGAFVAKIIGTIIIILLANVGIAYLIVELC